jgi:hypothetical protein
MRPSRMEPRHTAIVAGALLRASHTDHSTVAIQSREGDPIFNDAEIA